MLTPQEDIEQLDALVNALFAKLEDIEGTDVSSKDGRAVLKKHDTWVNAAGKIVTAKLVKVKLLDGVQAERTHQLDIGHSRRKLK